jgi:phosphomevalonate kinase
VSLHLTVPGNLLLLGEYAILEEGGLGLAMAVEPRVSLDALPAADLRVEGTWPGGSGETPLTSSAVSVVAGYLGRACTGSFRIDSTELFSADGRKTGLGSSAAVSVALVCGLLCLAGRHGAARGPEAAALAVRAHRLAQGGRGSGYDVLASFHGGSGVFRGGAAPSWEPRLLPPGIEPCLFPGPGPVSTGEAVKRYGEWKAADPGAAQNFLRDSNDAILSFLGSESEEDSLRWFGRCRQIGIELGNAIGVPAELAVPPGLDGRWCKAVGAGNELGVCLRLGKGACRPVRRAETGAAWPA